MNILPFTSSVAVTSVFALLAPLLDSPFVSGSAMRGSRVALCVALSCCVLQMPSFMFSFKKADTVPAFTEHNLGGRQELDKHTSSSSDVDWEQ